MGDLTTITSAFTLSSVDGGEKTLKEVSHVYFGPLKHHGWFSVFVWDRNTTSVVGDEAAKPNLKLLAMAKMWKKNKDVSGGDAAEDEEDGEENPDADDPTIANESSSSESEDEEEEESSKA